MWDIGFTNLLPLGIPLLNKFYIIKVHNIHSSFVTHVNVITKFKIPSSLGFLTNILADGKGHEITLELDAHKEGLLRDKFVLKNEAEEEFVIVLHARVLGARKGTPMLKEKIRCIHHAKDEEEEHSDWTGFE